MKKILIFILLAGSAVLQSQVLKETGTATNLGRIQMPFNRFIQPAGKQVFFGDASLENHALDAALSPDGKWLYFTRASGVEGIWRMPLTGILMGRVYLSDSMP